MTLEGYLLGQKCTFHIIKGQELDMLDEKDFEIIKLLDKDCRTSYSRIAKEVDLSVRAVSSRVDRLLKEGVIRCFTINFNTNLLGYRHYMLSISLQSDTSSIDFLNKIKSAIEINHIWEFQDGSFVFSVFCQEAYHFEKLLNKVITYGGKINNYDETRPNVPSDIPFSLMDWKILLYLYDNGRAGNSIIANTIGVSEKTIMRRINRMKNMKLVQFITEINFEAIKGMVTAIINLVTNVNSKDIYFQIKEDKDIKYWRSAGTVTPSITLFVYGQSITEIYEMFLKLKSRKDIKQCSLNFIVKEWKNSTIIRDAILLKIQQHSKDIAN